MKIILQLAALCWSASASAHPVRWTCDVTFLQSGHHAVRELRIDADEGTVDDDGIAWRDGARPAIFPGRTQYVDLLDGKILWGLRAEPAREVATFSLDPATGRYELSSPDDGTLARGACSVPDDKLS